jgi:hypothetical protein
MNKSTALLPILMAGMLAAAGVHAQSAPAAGSTDGPPKAGEASNQTMGAPNAKTTNSPFSEAPSPGATVIAPAATVTTVPAAPVVAATTVTTTTMGAAAASPEQEVISRRARFEAMRRAMLNGGHYSIVNGDIVVQ